MTNKKDKKKIKFIYKFADDYNPTYINGAHGSLTANNEIVINFYFERACIPYSQTNEILPNGKLKLIEDEQNPKDLNKSLLRFIAQGIILDYRGAKTIHQFLGNWISTLEERMISNESKKKKK